MADQVLTNPSGAFGLTGFDQKLPAEAEEFVANGAITAGNIVQFVAATAGATATVGRVVNASSTAAANHPLIVGIAMEDAVTGRAVRVAKGGYALANVAGTLTAGTSIVAVGSTDGVGTAVAATDGGTTVGRVVGVVLQDRAATTGLAPIWISRR